MQGRCLFKHCKDEAGENNHIYIGEWIYAPLSEETSNFALQLHFRAGKVCFHPN